MPEPSLSPPPLPLPPPMETNPTTPTLSTKKQIGSSIFLSFCRLDSILTGAVSPRSLHSHLTDKSSRWEDPSRGGSAPGDNSHGNGSGSNIPSLLSMATRSHMDITTPPLPQVGVGVGAGAGGWMFVWTWMLTDALFYRSVRRYFVLLSTDIAEG